MRSIKSVGGFTLGRGMTEKQQAVWLLPKLACSSVNKAMQKFTRVEYVSNAQHKDTMPARIKRDKDDTLKLIMFLHTYDPFCKGKEAP